MIPAHREQLVAAIELELRVGVRQTTTTVVHGLAAQYCEAKLN